MCEAPAHERRIRRATFGFQKVDEPTGFVAKINWVFLLTDHPDESRGALLEKMRQRMAALTEEAGQEIEMRQTSPRESGACPKLRRIAKEPVRKFG